MHRGKGNFSIHLQHTVFIVFFYELRLRRLKAIALKFVSRVVATGSFSFYHKIS